MFPSEPSVFVIDDDLAVRDSLEWLISSVGLKTRCFSSVDDFLDAYTTGMRGCVVTDVRMPKKSGLDLQAYLNKRHSNLPVIFITGHGDIRMAVRAMKAGALDFIQKPFNDQDFLDLVAKAIKHNEELHKEKNITINTKKLIDALTPREREVLEHIVAGETNKMISFNLGISNKTVEAHRSRVMHKMHVRSVASLVKLVLATQSPGTKR